MIIDYYSHQNYKSFFSLFNLKILKFLIYQILIALLIFNCSENEILPEEELVKIYVDILIAQDTTTNESITIDSLKAIVLKSYAVPESLYVKSIDYYNSTPAKWEEFFNNATKYVEKLKTNSEE
jgi:Domain of unknown function (DUF4296)